MANIETSDNDSNNDTATTGSDIISIEEAAKRLGKSERTIWRMIQVGTLQGVKLYGKTCVQMSGHQPVVVVPAKAVSQPNDKAQINNDTLTHNSNMTQTVNDRVSEPLVDALKETISILQAQIVNRDQEIQRLWERIPPTLPAPDSYNQMQQGGGQAPVTQSNDIWAYIAAAVLIVIAALYVFAR
ncbi:MAG: helix-turn-helix transcriptional regulator [Armatimonadota bacterium]